MELQEPTDLSILMEWKGSTSTAPSRVTSAWASTSPCGAVDRRAWPAADVAALRGARAGDLGDLLPDGADFFRVERTRGSVGVEAGFAVLVVVSGCGSPDVRRRHARRAGGPDGAAPARGRCGVRLDGDAEALWCRPPAPPLT